MDSNYLLEMKAISKYFPGTKALSNVNLFVEKGEVHSLVGENGAGKSTLMKIIGGVHQSEEGEIFFEGKKVNFQNPKGSQEVGIGLVHQELSLCPHMTVAENIFIGRLPKKKSTMVDYKSLYKKCQEVLDIFKVNFKPNQIVATLNIAEQQIVEIAKAISLNCKLLILDEPTSSLTQPEAEVLFEIVEMLKNNGVSILYISHRMEEIFRICDKITILRDGEYIGTVKTTDITENQIVNMMVGRNIENKYPPKSTKIIKKEILKVENLGLNRIFNDINFTLYQGEILGFSGIVGAGRTEVMRAVCGIDEKSKGTVYLNGKSLNIKTYSEAIKVGIGYVPEDRKEQGLFLDQSIEKNITAAILKKIKNGLFLKSSKERDLSSEYVKRLSIKISDVRQPVDGLSGGNQQKVLLAKWLAIEPKVLILDEPTRGIDIGAKLEIYKLLRELSEKGIGIIIVSSELPEVIGMCDRVAVMHEGKLKDILQKEDLTEDKIMILASGLGT
ncbi:sugar ABC transporter ATP-binding protein [Neobacillus cucumis]|uniref:sugar ABC transporter ATP-binding protein n=1 Tax=Neobacillus cucumis TaxID=1740721 RepID=UPI00203FF375|nr:sugar ABC transporter ATP-binding protein [Neobacillus cucumis]MCM3729195.1 sugar ABC transporter ATP-binding protein [Neobacillus cucumis]